MHNVAGKSLSRGFSLTLLYYRDLSDNVTLAEALNSKADMLLHRDDYTLLREVKLTLEQIEGVFTNPPPTTPRYFN